MTKLSINMPNQLTKAVCCVPFFIGMQNATIQKIDYDIDIIENNINMELVVKNFGITQFLPQTILENKINLTKIEFEWSDNQENSFNQFILDFLNEIELNHCQNLAEEIKIVVHEEDSIRIHLSKNDHKHNVVFYEDGDVYYSFTSKRKKRFSKIFNYEEVDSPSIINSFINS